MNISIRHVSLTQIASLRDQYRREMRCQIIHDSIHSRAGWTEEFGLFVGDSLAGYGSVAVAGPWKGKPTIYEFYVSGDFGGRAFDLFAALHNASGAVAIETQSNSTLLFVMLHTFAKNIFTESILFRDEVATTLSVEGAKFRKTRPEDDVFVTEFELDDQAQWGIELDGKLVAAGDVLFHYNRPYGDVYMKVADPFRRRGIGAFLVQELKRVCIEGGSVPGARCNPQNVASRRTLQKAGFVPFGHILGGELEPVPGDHGASRAR